MTEDPFVAGCRVGWDLAIKACLWEVGRGHWADPRQAQAAQLISVGLSALKPPPECAPPNPRRDPDPKTAASVRVVVDRAKARALGNSEPVEREPGDDDD